MKKAVVLCADNGYLDKVTTTIKSVCAHNRDIHFYVFNDDIPSEWFKILNHYLCNIGSSISNVKLLSEEVSGFKTREHINHTSYYRYFIADYVNEERVIYLDSDIIVTGDISELFTLDLGESYLAAVDEFDMNPMANEFNSGMLVINASKWREENVSSMLIENTKLNQDNLVNGDQQVFNYTFQDSYLKLDKKYNFLIGNDSLLACSNLGQYIVDITNNLPLVLHFLTPDKPWNSFSSSRLRDMWWFYYGLDWETVCSPVSQISGSYRDLIKNTLGVTDILILTSSGEIPLLKEIIEALPNCEFHIAALTPFWHGIISLERYQNVTLYPESLTFKIDELVSICQICLDIHVGYELLNVVSRFHDSSKDVFAFEDTVHSDKNNYTQIIESGNLQQLVYAITQSIDK